MRNPRLIATAILLKVLQEKISLPSALQQEKESVTENWSLIQELCYGVLRFYHQFEYVYRLYMKKPLKEKDIDIKIVLFLGFYQLSQTRIAPHAAIYETVDVIKQLGKMWATKLCNAVLRSFQREMATIEYKEPAALYSHPTWLVKAIQKAWPQTWMNILTANNQRPPYVLRVNQRLISTEDYLQKLTQQGVLAMRHEYVDSAIILNQSIDAPQLPGFFQGEISVQDAAAQLAAPLLQVKSSQRVLDACAAPGGKTMHLLELAPDIHLTALDIDEQRLLRVNENLTRIDAEATLKTADAAALPTWWDGVLFDRILCDVPCSALGVIRRHPDIKLLHQESDISALSKVQLQILTTLWSVLKPGGILLYATCSILPDENTKQIERFIKSKEDVKLLPIHLTVGIAQTYGWQILPGMGNMDGFYYALLQKDEGYVNP